MEKDNFSADELLKIAKENEKKSTGDMLNAVSARLSEDKKQTLFSVLSDKKALEKLLSSDEAQKLMKKFGQNK